jgi:DNA-binding beta-propeller fold protein YncE
MKIRMIAIGSLLCACQSNPPVAATGAPTAAPSASSAVAVASSIASSASSAEPLLAIDAGSATAAASTTAIALPGATGPVSIDYIGYDPAKNRVWVPVGDTGSVDVLDVATSTFTRVDGFKTAERESRGKKRMMGPSAVFIGDGFAYVGNRATSEVCAVDAVSLKVGGCLTLASSTDAVAYVSSAKEVWVTTPRDHSLTILDASQPGKLKAKTSIKTDGDPEGYAVDESKAVFYTNLEDKDRTLAIDVKSHTVKSNTAAGCGTDGPRGIAVDGARNMVLVACTDRVRVMDAAHGMALLASFDAGGGVDNIDYDQKTKRVVIGAGKASRITVGQVDDKGQITVVWTATTKEGARNAVADTNGNAYVVDPKGATLLVVKAPVASP